MAILTHLGSQRAGLPAMRTDFANRVACLTPARHMNLLFRWAQLGIDISHYDDFRSSSQIALGTFRELLRSLPSRSGYDCDG